MRTRSLFCRLPCCLLCCLLLLSAWSLALASGHPPERVVSLAPSVTEIVYALGAGEVLVGAAEHSDYPPEADRLPRVGSYARPDLERIVGLGPDLCLGVRDGTPPQAAHALRELGIPVRILETDTLEQLLDAILEVGRLLGREPEARTLVLDMRTRLGTVRHLAERAEDRPRVLFQVSGPRIMVAGRDSLLGHLIEMAGGENVAPPGAAYPQLSAEEFLALRPDVVVAFHMLGQGDGMSGWPRDPLIPAVSLGRLHEVDPALFGRPGPRLPQALEDLARIIHPELFGAPEP